MMKRNDYIIVVDKGEAFIWIHWAGLSATTHAEIVLVHLWQGYDVTEWMPWMVF
jgi:hypothetical protein